MKLKRILIVDDNPVIIATLSMKLKSAGYEVASAVEASEAMTSVRREKPDLILLDINFPLEIGMEWDGFKIIAWLQRLEGQSSTPVIVISGGEAAKFKQRSLDAGAVAYFQKPVDNDELLATIENALKAAKN